jgi:outer membrane protein W
MRTRLAAAFASIALLILPSTLVHADTEDGGVNLQLLGGIKVLNDNDWDPADEQTAFGLQFDIQPEDWPFHFTTGLITAESSSEETNVSGIGNVTAESQTTEIMAGIKKYFSNDELRPFLGVGLTVIRGELETTTPLGSDSDSGTGVGPWVSLGALYMISDWLGLGGQVLYSTAETEIFGQDLDAGGLHADALLSLTF